MCWRSKRCDIAVYVRCFWSAQGGEVGCVALEFGFEFFVSAAAAPLAVKEDADDEGYGA